MFTQDELVRALKGPVLGEGSFGKVVKVEIGKEKHVCKYCTVFAFCSKPGIRCAEGPQDQDSAACGATLTLLTSCDD